MITTSNRYVPLTGCSDAVFSGRRGPYVPFFPTHVVARNRSAVLSNRACIVHSRPSISTRARLACSLPCHGRIVRIPSVIARANRVLSHIRPNLAIPCWRYELPTDWRLRFRRRCVRPSAGQLPNQRLVAGRSAILLAERGFRWRFPYGHIRFVCVDCWIVSRVLLPL